MPGNLGLSAEYRHSIRARLSHQYAAKWISMEWRQGRQRLIQQPRQSGFRFVDIDFNSQH